jgi:hypothetical protein
MNWNEDNIEIFIRENKDQFSKYDPSTYHDNIFLKKLYKRFKKFISIVPYLVKVFIVTIIVFVISIWSWNNYLRKDRHEITLKQKIENYIQLIKK